MLFLSIIYFFCVKNMTTISRTKEQQNTQDIETLFGELIPLDKTVTPTDGDILVYDIIKQEYVPTAFDPFDFPLTTNLHAANSTGWVDIQSTIDTINDLPLEYL